MSKIKDDTTGNLKYSKLSKLALCLFVLPHGNSDPERGFSMNKNCLTVHGTSLKEDTIIALRFIKDAIILNNGAMNINISKDFIKSGQSARISYQAYLDAQKLEKERSQKRKAEVEANKKKEEDKNKKLDLIKECQIDLKTLKAGIKVAEDVISVGNAELGEVLKKKPFNEPRLKLCQTKIDMGLKWKNELQSEVTAVEKKIKKMN